MVILWDVQGKLRDHIPLPKPDTVTDPAIAQSRDQDTGPGGTGSSVQLRSREAAYASSDGFAERVADLTDRIEDAGRQDSGTATVPDRPPSPSEEVLRTIAGRIQAIPQVPVRIHCIMIGRRESGRQR